MRLYQKLYRNSWKEALLQRSACLTFIGAGIGDTCIFPALKRCHLAPEFAKIEPYSNKIDLKYALYYLMSDLGQLGVRVYQINGSAKSINGYD